MAIKTELLEKFKMKQTAEALNLKTHIGEILQVATWEISEYSDVDGNYHRVLALSVIGTSDFYRTEVAAFIEKFQTYIDVFGNEPLEDRPRIKITGKTSKRKNEYISFEIVDENGNIL